MISIKTIIFSNYMIGDVWCDNRSHPENILYIRHPDSKIRTQGKLEAAKQFRRMSEIEKIWTNSLALDI